MLILILLPVAFLLPPGAEAGEIIGGQEAQPHSRPYMAYLKIQRGNETFRCGGFLVAENFVLTAAHCEGDEITVTLGAHRLSEQERSQQKIPVKRQIRHPRYNRETTNNDIMLLQLHHKARLTKKVGLIDLTSAHRRVSPGTMCSVAGWGMTSLTNTTNTLQEVNLSVISDKTCYNRYHYYYRSSMMCAGDPDDQKSVYYGDSGGPLVCCGVAEGIVCKCMENSIEPPVVYTRISHFMPWITDTMRGI
ncbi:mast cell protease 1A-like [Trachemys scripta elegans]|uniref:mast cell protease 1A-like n=1 Tax=Trachemys scripta elegans TaxID=31138 RepID=UPI00155319D8|nr:mast cell protease 1A-like [Trachemys scripta elegans]